MSLWDWTVHLQHLREVLQLSRSNHLFAKRRKCLFGTSQVECLGHVIFGGTVSMNPSKVEGVQTWPSPQSIKELKGFLGLSGYYRRFIQSYEVLAGPLTNLLKKCCMAID